MVAQLGSWVGPACWTSWKVPARTRLRTAAGSTGRIGRGSTTSGRRSATTTTTIVSTAEPISWAGSARNPLDAQLTPAMARAPSTSRPVVTPSATRPPQGLRPGQMPSTSAIGVAMLQTTCRVSTNTVQGSPMPMTPT